MQLVVMALLGSVFLNGVKIDGVTNQTFRGCDVTIDSSGNVLITAKGYRVERSETKTENGGAPGQTVIVQQSEIGPSPSQAPSRPSRRYFLVSMQNRTGATQYDVDVIVNGKFVGTIRSKEMQVIKEITGWVHEGGNQVVMAAKKNYGGGARVSSSVADYFKIILGEGTENAGKVTLENPLVEFKRTADETSNPTQEFSFKAK
jgi:hypothetical protein